MAAYGADDFPAFFTPSSGCRATCRVDTPEQAAALIRAGQDLELSSGIVIGEQAGNSPMAVLPVNALSSPLAPHVVANGVQRFLLHNMLALNSRYGTLPLF